MTAASAPARHTYGTLGQYAEASRAKGDIEHAKSLLTEGRICRKLVLAATLRGWSVSVYDGEEWCLVRSRKVADVLHAMASTDEDVLMFRDGAGDKVGKVWLVYGNGAEVISDYSDTPVMAEFMAPIETYAERA